MRSLKITPAFVVLLLGILVSLPATYHYVRVDNGSISNLGLIAGGYTLLLITFLVIERVVVFVFNPPFKNLMLVETSILSICIIVLSLNRSTLYLKVNDNCNWFAVFYVKNSTRTETEYIFPKDKIINVLPYDVTFINKAEFGKDWNEVETMNPKWNHYVLYDKDYDTKEKGFCSIYIASRQVPDDTLLEHVRTILNKRFQ